MKKTRVLLFGATGAVGGEILKALLSMPRVGKVMALGRRKVEIPRAWIVPINCPRGLSIWKSPPLSLNI